MLVEFCGNSYNKILDARCSMLYVKGDLYAEGI